VTDGQESGALVSADTATYVASPDIRTPMGGHLISFATAAAARAHVAAAHLREAQYLRYEEALRLGVQEGPGARP
jgi:hypothetical protein